jgi:hypothetical protein
MEAMLSQAFAPPARLIRGSLRIRDRDKFGEFSTWRLAVSTEFYENIRFVVGSAGPPQDAVITRFREHMTPQPRSARPQ